MQMRSLQSVVEKECEERLSLTEALAHAKEQLLAVAVVRSRDPSLAVAGSLTPVPLSDTRTSRSSLLLQPPQQQSRESSSSLSQSGVQSQASSASSVHTRSRPPGAGAGAKAVGDRKGSLPPLPPTVSPGKRTNGMVPSLSLLHMLDSRK